MCAVLCSTNHAWMDHVTLQAVGSGMAAHLPTACALGVSTVAGGPLPLSAQHFLSAVRSLLRTGCPSTLCPACCSAFRAPQGITTPGCQLSTAPYASVYGISAAHSRFVVSQRTRTHNCMLLPPCSTAYYHILVGFRNKSRKPAVLPPLALRYYEQPISWPLHRPGLGIRVLQCTRSPEP